MAQDRPETEAKQKMFRINHHDVLQFSSFHLIALAKISLNNNKFKLKLKLKPARIEK